MDILTDFGKDYCAKIFNQQVFQRGGMIGTIEHIKVTPDVLGPEGSVKVVHSDKIYYVYRQDGALKISRLCSMHDGFWLEDVEDTLWPWTVREIVKLAAEQKMGI